MARNNAAIAHPGVWHLRRRPIVAEDRQNMYPGRRWPDAIWAALGADAATMMSGPSPRQFAA